jgi:hypothetical protein
MNYKDEKQAQGTERRLEHIIGTTHAAITMFCENAERACYTRHKSRVKQYDPFGSGAFCLHMFLTDLSLFHNHCVSRNRIVRLMQYV